MKVPDEGELVRRQDETFRRMHKLYKKGYRIDWDRSCGGDAFWFDHPGHEARAAPALILYADGKVVTRGGSMVLNPGEKDDRDRIYNYEPSDDRQFDRWLETVEMPNWREQTAVDRERLIWVPGCTFSFYVVPWVLLLVFGGWIRKVWHSIVG